MPLRPPARAVLPLLAAALLVPGSGDRVAASHTPGGELFDLAALPGIETTGPQMVDALDAFVTAYPYRLTGGPTERLAAESIRAEMAGLGYAAAVEPLPLAAAAPGTEPLKVVTAAKRGTTRPDEWLVVVGHYDTIATTVEGAYDNGAGTSLIRFLARELATVPTNRSVLFAWYNGEEEGLLASRAHAAQLKGQGRDIKAVLGFDMPGIAWPVAPTALTSRHCLCMFHGARDAAFKPLLEQVTHGFLGMEKGVNKTTVVGPNTRNSDEQSFAAQGYPTLRWAGMRAASDYPAYHKPDDTMETIYRVAGGREYFEQGSLNTLRSAYYTFLALDNHLPVPRVTGTGDGTLSSATSSDADGEPRSPVWTLADGSTVEGPTLQLPPGTHEVRLTVADNLWPAVTRSTTATVTVD